MAGIRVDGLGDVLSRLNELQPSPEEARTILANSARPLRAAMKRKAPTDTTLLQQVITIEDLSEGTDIKIGIGVFDPDVVKYVIYQEFGTGKYATGPGGSQAKRIPWLWTVKSQKWADIFKIKVGESVIWYGNHPHPFLRPAWDEEKENTRKIIIQGISDLIIERSA